MLVVAGAGLVCRLLEQFMAVARVRVETVWLLMLPALVPFTLAVAAAGVIRDTPLELAVKAVAVLAVEHQMAPRLQQTQAVAVAVQEEMRPLAPLRIAVVMAALALLL
jgi:hypothetical protein